MPMITWCCDDDDADADIGDDDVDDWEDDYIELGYLWLSSLQAICQKIARGATYEAISAENVINEWIIAKTCE